MDNQPLRLSDEAALRQQQLVRGETAGALSKEQLAKMQREEQDRQDVDGGQKLYQELARQYSTDENGAPRSPTEVAKLMAADPLIKGNPYAFKPFAEDVVKQAQQVGLLGQYGQAADMLKSVGAIPQDFDPNKPEDQKRMQFLLSGKNPEAFLIDQATWKNHSDYLGNQQTRLHGQMAQERMDLQAAMAKDAADRQTQSLNAYADRVTAQQQGLNQRGQLRQKQGPLAQTNPALGAVLGSSQSSPLGSGTSLGLADPTRLADVGAPAPAPEPPAAPIPLRAPAPGQSVAGTPAGSPTNQNPGSWINWDKINNGIGEMIKGAAAQGPARLSDPLADPSN